MSLFKLKKWWGIKPSSEEECDFGCLCISNIDNGNADKIIVGSYHGVLHIYSPSEGDGGENPHDILLESQMQAPILQVVAGKFVSVSSDLHLAVLQPRLITIFAISVKQGAVDHGHQCIRNKIYEHKLERTAVNMTYGPFGGVKDRDFLCVQSMDGTLSMFESENYTFTRFIPGFLMPGPLAYNAKLDQFLTLSSNRCLEAYSFQVLAVAASSNTKEESQLMTTGKKINADWKLNIGEHAVDIRIITLENGKTCIMVLGERNLFCVEETGQLKYMKKLECNPACFYPYLGQDGESIMCVVCSHSRQLLVYEGISLKWATLLDVTPVQVAVGSFRNMPGMIITLSDKCHVSCTYLGTHPSVFNLPQSTQREPNYITLEQEMAKVNGQIKQLHISKGDVLSQTKESDDLSVRISIPQTKDHISAASEQISSTAEGNVPSITVQIQLKAARRVTNVEILIHVDLPLVCTQKHMMVPAVAENDPAPCIFVPFFLQNEFPPSSLSFEVVVHYLQVSGIPKAVSKTAHLPLSLISWPHEPIKTLEHKVTLETNKPCVNLMELFPELSSADAGPNCVGIRLIHGPCTTILTSKSSNRYRIQSETYSGLWLFTDELVRRLQKFYSDSDLKISHPQPVNLEEIMSVIDRHFQLRLSRENVKMMLEQRAKQFRLIQRRLLTRFKDKTPSPLICLDTLLEGTYRQILALSDACEENHQTLLMSNSELSSCLRLLILLSKFWLNLSDKEVTFMESVLCVDLKDTDVGWEETIYCSLSALIKTTLSRGGKESSAGLMPQNSTSLQFPLDVSKVKKHLALLFDRLSKGSRLISPSLFSTTTNHKNPNMGPISNISIKQGQNKHNGPPTLNSIPRLPLKRGISEEITEEQSALIDDIISSTPINTSYHSVQPPKINSLPRKDIPSVADPEPSLDNTHPSPVYQSPKEEVHAKTEDEPSDMVAGPIPIKDNTDDDYDIIESPYDHSMDDMIEM